MACANVSNNNNESEPTRILQPISLNTITNVSKKVRFDVEQEIPCLLCDEKFSATDSGVKNPVLAHLLSEHKLIIADVEKIANFPQYMVYWKEKFKQVSDIREYCVVINTNTKPEDKDPQEKYFLLTDFLPEDKALRDDLNNKKLSVILDEQLKERKDKNFSRRCLFCKVMFHGNRAKLFLHMAKDHSFNLGNPDNIVNAGEFLDIIKSKLEKFTCMFCEKEFKEWQTLKEHMRKKSHKRIDPKNKAYDKYYLINYLDPGKDWKEVQSEPEYEKEREEYEDENCEKEYEDWIEEGAIVTLCLFCNKMDEDVNNILKHMKSFHEFDLHAIKKDMGLTFYHQIKIVNYIRRQLHENKCPHCLQGYEGKDKLQSHLSKEKHYTIPTDQQLWDQPGYFFPTFDDDNLLCFLEDDEPLEEEQQQFEATIRSSQDVNHNENFPPLEKASP